VLQRAFIDFNADRLITGTAAANIASCRLLDRLGFTKYSESVGSFNNDADGKHIEFLGYMFTLTKEEWKRTVKKVEDLNG
jgi:RimJ/RimL family protein N-acetyltransferase